MSTASGLAYFYTRTTKPAWTFIIGVDFRSGEIVWEQQIGTESQFDSYVPGPMIGPGGALYVGVNGGFISMQDTR
jgi:glucose dehydrogenase